jgi:hypothetical protein
VLPAAQHPESASTDCDAGLFILTQQLRRLLLFFVPAIISRCFASCTSRHHPDAKLLVYIAALYESFSNLALLTLRLLCHRPLLAQRLTLLL